MKNILKKELISVLVLACFLNLEASTGALDLSFNAAGTGANGPILTNCIQTDGKIVIGGIFTSFNGDSVYHVARLNADGSLDTTFNKGGRGTDIPVPCIKLQLDGKIIIGGQFNTYNGDTVNGIARLNTDGSIDSSFKANDLKLGGTHGGQNYSEINSLAIQSDGKIVVAAYSNYTGEQIVIRLNTDGSADNTFIPPSFIQNDIIQACIIQPDGRIVFGGDFGMLRLNADGSSDGTFTTYNSSNSGYIHTMALQADGKIIFGTDDFIARLSANGSLDSTFQIPSNFSPVVALAVQNDDRIFAGGLLKNGTLVQGNIILFDSTGIIDSSFNQGGTGPANDMNNYNNGADILAITLGNDGSIIVSGSFATFNGVTVGGIARLLNNVTGVEILTDINSIRIYPNPSNGKYIFTSMLEAEADVKIYDMAGNMVYNKLFPNLNQASVDLSAKAKGVYIIKVTCQTNVDVYKVVLD